MDKRKLITVIIIVVLLVGLGACVKRQLNENDNGGRPPATTTTPVTTYVTTTSVPPPTTTAPPVTTTTGSIACSEAPAMLNLPLDERSEGSDFHVQLVGDTGIYKGVSVNFDHFGTSISSTAIVFNHFDVTIVGYHDDINWGAITIRLDIWGAMEGGDWYELGFLTEADIPLAMTDPYTTVFGYDLELNYYELLGNLHGIVYGDGTTLPIYLDMIVHVWLTSVSTGDWLDGGDGIYYGAKISGFEYCVDTSGIYDANIEYWEWD